MLLKTLELFYDDVAPTPTMPQFLSILVSNPHLQKFMLNPQATPNSDGDRSYQVPLPCLEELWLDGATGQVFELLCQLEYPQKIGILLLNLFPVWLQTFRKQSGLTCKTTSDAVAGLGMGLGSSFP